MPSRPPHLDFRDKRPVLCVERDIDERRLRLKVVLHMEGRYGRDGGGAERDVPHKALEVDCDRNKNVA